MLSQSLRVREVSPGRWVVETACRIRLYSTDDENQVNVVKDALLTDSDPNASAGKVRFHLAELLRAGIDDGWLTRKLCNRAHILESAVD